MKARAQAAFAAYVRASSDRMLDRTIGSRVAMRAIFKGMQRAFVADAAAGFEGEIQYVLTRSRGRPARHWIVEVAERRALARPGSAGAPAVTLTTSVPTFARIGAGELSPALALLSGDLAVEGNILVAARLGEMFGAAPPVTPAG